MDLELIEFRENAEITKILKSLEFECFDASVLKDSDVWIATKQ